MTVSVTLGKLVVVRVGWSCSAFVVNAYRLAVQTYS